MLEQERQRIEQLTAGWDDPTQVDWGAEDDQMGEDGRSERVQSVPGLKCTALYSYTVRLFFPIHKLKIIDMLVCRLKIPMS